MIAIVRLFHKLKGTTKDMKALRQRSHERAAEVAHQLFYSAFDSQHLVSCVLTLDRSQWPVPNVFRATIVMLIEDELKALALERHFNFHIVEATDPDDGYVFTLQVLLSPQPLTSASR